MSKKNTVDHIGVVQEITPAYIDVEILNKSMCAACHAKSMCTMSDVSAKIIRVNNPLDQIYQVGEEVKVVMKKSMGLRAVWISYVSPLIILMILLLYLPCLNFSELCAGLIAVGGMALYYLVIWLLRDKIAREFTFTIEKHNKHQI